MGGVVKRQREEKQEIQLLQQNLQNGIVGKLFFLQLKMTHLVIRMLAFLTIAFLPIVSADCDASQYIFDQVDCEGVCSYTDSTNIACFGGITHGAYGSCEDGRKRTAMHLAALEDDADCVGTTLLRGVENLAKDEDGKTAGDLALSEGNCNAYRAFSSFNEEAGLSLFGEGGIPLRNLTDQQFKCVAPCCAKIQISSTSTSGAAAYQPVSFHAYPFTQFDFNGFAYYGSAGSNRTIYNDPTSGRWMVGRSALNLQPIDNDDLDEQLLMASETCTGPCPNAKACNKGWSYYHNGQWNSDENITLKCVPFYGYHLE